MVRIPHQLLEATDLFRRWADDQIPRSEEERKITVPLYHYTDASGLKGIIENQQIWFTSYQYLNDPSELSFGIDAAQKAIRAVSAKGPAKAFCDRLAERFTVQNIANLKY